MTNDSPIRGNYPPLEEPIGKSSIRRIGLEVGSVSLKYCSISAGGLLTKSVLAHKGNPRKVLTDLLDAPKDRQRAFLAVTGYGTRFLVDGNYRPESECIERALSEEAEKPDILLSLGGETFSVYTLKHGLVRNVVTSSKCASGTGEFIVQQLLRMGMTLEQGIEEARNGTIVALASRCSVFCKSDATHKLNKGECRTMDIAASLIDDLAGKVKKIVDSANWPVEKIVVCGGLIKNPLFLDALRLKLPTSSIVAGSNGECYEAWGAALLAGDDPADPKTISSLLLKPENDTAAHLRPLVEALPLLDYRVKRFEDATIRGTTNYILGVDAGSTTTKAVLFDPETGKTAIGCYLRTLGDPVAALKSCLTTILERSGCNDLDILDAAVTGSGRELVSVYLDNCRSYNEILAHARAAREEVADVDTVFEIGGQDSKFISFDHGIPRDYAMNEGCSAGTGSFLEEAVSVDMGIPVELIGEIAIAGEKPLAFGERCAAFINTDLRAALQLGQAKENILAGLVHSIVENYLSHVVGFRQVGSSILFQGGVALNKAVALAIAAQTGRTIVVPAHPELMGCIGSALMVRDDRAKTDKRNEPLSLRKLADREMKTGSLFTCPSCENNCEIRNYDINGRKYPFGGHCAKYDNHRHHRGKRKEGIDFVALRNEIVFGLQDGQDSDGKRGTIGLPMALSTYEYYPLYRRFFELLGWKIVRSEFSKAGNAKTKASICYPCEIVHGAVYDLLTIKKVDFVFLPSVIEDEALPGFRKSFFCVNSGIIPALVQDALPDVGERLLHPHFALSADLSRKTEDDLIRMGTRLDLTKKQVVEAFAEAKRFFASVRHRLVEVFQEYLPRIIDQPKVILVGRPYLSCSGEVNLALPKKLTSRGYHAIPADILPKIDSSRGSDIVWHYSQNFFQALEYADRLPKTHLLLLSCYNCAPDGVLHHRYCDDLGGRTYCFLEIDAHSAHGGFDTRIGAFLDIIEGTEC